MLLRGCGARIGVQSFKERHGLHACVVAPTRIIAGLAMSLGMVCLDVPGATGGQLSSCADMRSEIAMGFLFGMLRALLSLSEGASESPAHSIALSQASNGRFVHACLC